MRAEEKAATRQKLLGMNHSLHNLLHYRLSDSLSARPLRAAQNGEKRCYVQKNVLSQAYLWNPVTSEHVAVHRLRRLL